MRKHLFPSILILVLIVACKKNDAPDSKNLLDKIVAKRVIDSIFNTYTYDAQSRFLKETKEDPVNNQTATLTVSRDNSGRVSRMIIEIRSIDSAFQTIDFFYLTATDSKIRNGKAIYTWANGIIDDSIVYVYTGSRVTRIDHYFFNGLSYALGQYYTYAYDAKNNITSIRFYELDAGGTNVQLIMDITYTYDGKINPLYSKDDAFMEYVGLEFVSPNNITSMTVFSAAVSTNVTTNFAYEYRTDGRPAKRTATVNGATTVSTYFYR